MGGSGLGGSGFGHQSKNHVAVRPGSCFILAGGFGGQQCLSLPLSLYTSPSAFYFGCKAVQRAKLTFLFKLGIFHSSRTGNLRSALGLWQCRRPLAFQGNTFNPHPLVSPAGLRRNFLATISYARPSPLPSEASAAPRLCSPWFRRNTLRAFPCHARL